MNLILPNGVLHEVPPETKPLPDLFGVPQAPEPYDYKKEALEEAVGCWTDPAIADIPIDMRIAAVVASRIAEWMKVAAQGYRGAEFYRNIIDQCGRSLGIEAFTSDDGSVQQDVLALRLHELVVGLIPEGERATRLASVPKMYDKPASEEVL